MKVFMFLVEDEWFLELHIAFMIIKRKVEDNSIAYCILAYWLLVFLVEDEGLMTLVLF